MDKDSIVVAVIGNAKTGKSTLIGKVVRKKTGGTYNGEEFEPSQFETPKYQVTIYEFPDAESLQESVENGTMKPDVALLCVSAATGEGINEGDDEAPRLIAVAKELGIPQMALAVTKMDSTLWNEDRFNEMAKEIMHAVRHTKPTHYDPRYIPYVPVSAVSDAYGANMLEQSQDMPWFKFWSRGLDHDRTKGKTLLDAIDVFRPIRQLQG